MLPLTRLTSCQWSAALSDCPPKAGLAHQDCTVVTQHKMCYSKRDHWLAADALEGHAQSIDGFLLLGCNLQAPSRHLVCEQDLPDVCKCMLICSLTNHVRAKLIHPAAKGKGACSRKG